jgi:beta-ureidopropionase / N-carbamoyl-L-amino-acid hydrolase
LTTADLRINSERLRADFDELAEIGATMAGGISRLALSNEDLEARAWFAGRIEEVGLRVNDDDVGNLSGVLLCDDPDAHTLIIGSHLDSVPNGGRYDGSIGVLAGLECLRTIKEAEIRLPVHLEVIDFTDEEGNWQGLFGSMGLTGRLNSSHINDAIEDHGAFRAALFRAGIRPSDVAKAQRDPDTLAGFLELHIEQGYRLDQAGVEIGIVTAVVGRSTYNITFFGEAAHAATTSMDMRHDALQGAASFILKSHRLIREQYTEGVFNCGNIEVSPGAFNITPQQACLTVEMRHPDEDILADMENALLKLAHECAQSQRLRVNAKRILHRIAAPLATPVVEAIERACQTVDASYMRLVSYSGHDIQMMSNFTASGMVFIPSVGGISHNPREFSHWEHVEAGANVLLQTILDLARNSENPQRD